jgi:cytoplasmic iron level regulating protein YaaA (DUF328/UPF0246 family)
MELVLIACCKRKQSGGQSEYHNSAALTSNLSTSGYARLMNARRELANIMDSQPGLDLGLQDHDPGLLFFPAYQRYTGNVYSSSQIATLFPKTISISVVIISALYGLLDANDLIRHYDCAMNDTLPNGVKLKTWWKRQGLGEIVSEYIKEARADCVHDFLSGHYRDALQLWPSGSTENIVSYSYPNQGSGSSWSRGKDIKGFLHDHIVN